jgi:hypothetical protein
MRLGETFEHPPPNFVSLEDVDLHLMVTAMP